MQVLPWSVESRVVELGGQEGRGGGAEDEDQGGEPQGAKEGREEKGGLWSGYGEKGHVQRGSRRGPRGPDVLRGACPIPHSCTQVLALG